MITPEMFARELRALALAESGSETADAIGKKITQLEDFTDELGNAWDDLENARSAAGDLTAMTESRFNPLINVRAIGLAARAFLHATPGGNNILDQVSDLRAIWEFYCDVIEDITEDRDDAWQDLSAALVTVADTISRAP
jgi:hypothetical protein